jgi:hypothetical protein
MAMAPADKATEEITTNVYKYPFSNTSLYLKIIPKYSMEYRVINIHFAIILPLREIKYHIGKSVIKDIIMAKRGVAGE